MKNKKINTTELVMLIISSAIGTGIFGLSSQLAQITVPGPLLIAWLICGCGILSLVLSLNNLTK